MAAEFHGCLKAFLPPVTWPELAGIAVAVGPGSFTSCRLGVTVARSLGETLDIPVFGLSSLAAIAYAKLAGRGRGSVLGVQMDAKRGEWYGGIYALADNGLEVITSDRIWTEHAWQERVAGLETVDAAVLNASPPAIALTQLALPQYRRGDRPPWHSVEPVYIRQPPIHRGT